MIRARCGASVLCWCGGPLSLGLLGGPRPCSGDTATQRGRRRAACRVHGAADLVLMDHIARSPSCRSVAAGGPGRSGGPKPGDCTQWQRTPLL